MSVRPAISPMSSPRSGVAGSACTSAVCASKPLISELPSGATPENTRYWSLGSAHSIRLRPGSSKYSALLADTPMPTVPDQSVTSGSSALR
ncbi:hypothetical protein D9M72_292700 [compost metagenome]